MNILKKTTLCALAALSIMATSAQAATFPDMPSGKMGVAIENAVANGLISGFNDGTVKPYDPITRAQMATIITRAFGTIDNAEANFGDVPADAWYKDAVEKAVFMGAFQGDEKGNFKPNNNITFQETYTVLARVFQYETRSQINMEGLRRDVPYVDEKALDKFSDADTVADWAKEYAIALVSNAGYTGIDGKLQGKTAITRGQFAMIMDELVSLYIDEAGTYTQGFGTGAVVVRANDVTIDGIETNRNIVIGYAAEKNINLKNVNSKATIAVYGGRDRTPVDTKDSAGNIIKRADEIFVNIEGNIHDVRVMPPHTAVGIKWTNENPGTEVFIKTYDKTSYVQPK